LRSYLLASLKNFLSKARHRELTVKRGEGRPLISLEDLLARERADQEPAHKLSADRIYERRWALTLLEQVLARLRAEYEAAGKLPLFDRLKDLLAGESGQPSQAKIAAEMRNDRKRRETSVSPLALSLSAVVARRDCSHGRGAGRCRGRAATFHGGITNVTCERISGSTDGDDKSAGKQDDKQPAEFAQNAGPRCSPTRRRDVAVYAWCGLVLPRSMTKTMSRPGQRSRGC
jgi:hypothetical protein